MSQYYQCDIDISPVEHSYESTEGEAERDALENALGLLCFTIDGSTDLSPTKIGFYGNISLCGGQSPREKHEELRAAFPGKKIASRWLNREVHTWDAEFDDDEEDEEADVAPEED